MIYGVEAGTISPPPSTPPFTGRGLLNFLTGNYQWDGTPLAIGDTIDHPELIGGTGLAIGYHGEVQFTSAAVTTFLAACNFTVALEVEVDNNEAYQYLLRIENVSRGNFAYLLYNYYFEAYDSNQTWQRDFFDYVNGTDGGIVRIAATRTNTLFSLSVAGNAVVHNTTSLILPEPGYPMGFFGFGKANNGEAFKVRTIKFFDVQDESTLPTLST